MRPLTSSSLQVTMIVAFAIFSAPAQAMESPLAFQFTKGQSLLDFESGTTAEQTLAANIFSAVEAAGEVWRSVLRDDATLNFVIELDGLPPGSGGQAIPEFIGPNYSDVIRPALLADRTSADDRTAAGSLPLPLASGIEFITHDTTVIPAPRIRDDDGSGNNRDLILTRANAKALGIVSPNDSDLDGTIRVLSEGPWDFDREDGIDRRRVDFVGLVVHEIGHQLGFFSGVEFLDVFGGNGVPPEGPLADQLIDLSGEAIFFPIDLFRYTDDSLSQPNQPRGGLRDWSFGSPSVADTPFFSIDGGRTELATFSTGTFNGDGFGPSHWEDNLDLGVMDPTLDFGLRAITALDLQAFDVIGWDLSSVPEPGSATLAVLMLAVVGWRGGRSEGRRGIQLLTECPG